MRIEWNEVTWYSWVVAAIVFGGAFAAGIFLGMKIQAKADLAPVAQHADATQMTSGGEKVLTAVTYACDGGKQIQALYMDAKVHVATSDGKDLLLPQTRSADGGRYANSNESFIFWSKGNGAFVMQTVSGVSTTTYANCTQIAAPVQ